MAILRQILERLKLTLNETKTKIINAHKEKFDFLKFSIKSLGRKVCSLKEYRNEIVAALDFLITGI
jgi:hypothetical protein